VAGVTLIELPVPTNVPPHDPVYQYTVPTAPLAVNVEDCPAQIDKGDAVIDVGVGVEFTHAKLILKADVVE
jgi:hypothetical protein